MQRVLIKLPQRDILPPLYQVETKGESSSSDDNDNGPIECMGVIHRKNGKAAKQGITNQIAGRLAKNPVFPHSLKDQLRPPHASLYVPKQTVGHTPRKGKTRRTGQNSKTQSVLSSAKNEKGVSSESGQIASGGEGDEANPGVSNPLSLNAENSAILTEPINRIVGALNTFVESSSDLIIANLPKEDAFAEHPHLSYERIKALCGQHEAFRSLARLCDVVHHMVCQRRRCCCSQLFKPGSSVPETYPKPIKRFIEHTVALTRSMHYKIQECLANYENSDGLDIEEFLQAEIQRRGLDDQDVNKNLKACGDLWVTQNARLYFEAVLEVCQPYLEQFETISLQVCQLFEELRSHTEKLKISIEALREELSKGAAQDINALKSQLNTYEAELTALKSHVEPVELLYWATIIQHNNIFWQAYGGLLVLEPVQTGYGYEQAQKLLLQLKPRDQKISDQFTELVTQGVTKGIPKELYYFLSHKNLVPLIKTLFGDDLEFLKDIARKESQHPNAGMGDEVVLIRGRHNPYMCSRSDKKRFFQDACFGLIHEHVKVYVASLVHLASLNPAAKRNHLNYCTLSFLRALLNIDQSGKKILHIPLEKNCRVLKRSHPKDTQRQQLIQHYKGARQASLERKAKTCAPAPPASQSKKEARRVANLRKFDALKNTPLRMKNVPGSNFCYLNCLLHAVMNDSVLSQSWDLSLHQSRCLDCQSQRPCMTQTLGTLLNRIPHIKASNRQDYVHKQTYWDPLVALLQSDYPLRREHSAGECFLHLMGRSEILANRFLTDAIWRCR